MSAIDRMLTSAAFKILSRRKIDLMRLLYLQGISGVSFSTLHGPVLVPTNSRSIVNEFASGGYFGQPSLEKFLAIRPRSKRVLNIGANIGTAARFIMASGLYAEIDCFEPDPQNFVFLQMNMVRQHGVRLHNEALGSIEGRLNLFLNPESIGRHSFKTDFGHGTHRAAVRRLDSFVGPKEHFDIFMDVEGWEVEVLRGASDRLANCQVCAFEWNGQLHGPDDRRDAARILEIAGFSIVKDLGPQNVTMSIQGLVQVTDQREFVALR